MIYYNKIKFLPSTAVPLYDTRVDKHGCKIFIVRRYNKNIIDFSRIRSRTLQTIVKNENMPCDTNCDIIFPISSSCLKCKRSFALYSAVTYFHCGHSCLCIDCDEIYSNDNNKCIKCKTGVVYKLMYKKY
ncbi:hypothetical protein [Lonomia obliqua multiple nucleopolyhedrovirus]|uniref:RING-type domain-containing protein n=1 Tax=Lonomia obliqua multiple nucleopolyhedrovirus TaxID=134394 RepID=A0A126FCH0_9ABAC|nr:hypothetical protein [Lonomia obliqua multiple nucleopolyhedrovirus]AKN81065.1 hypothetical protein [Lonomia obliqua multiple nucleopolyhedrovirus]